MIVRHARALRWSSRFSAATAIAGLALLCAGCGVMEGPTLDPKGPIALSERNLLFKATAIMMIVIIPVFIMAAWFTIRYRGTNRKAKYTPNFDFYWPAEIVVWSVPAAIVIWLAFHLWEYTYKLDPYTQIDPSVKPLQVQAIAQDWKWLFVYPEHDIAVVNELAMPVDTPVSIEITSDTVMNSLVIPKLGGQIYAMAGMQTRLNLVADEQGTFWGRNVQYSGRGFADQQFQTHAMSKDDFDAWIEKVKQSNEALDAATYETLAKPSQKVPVTYYSPVEPNLFDCIIGKYSHGDADRMPPARKAEATE
ncbi:MAG: ubiquinol oxidase subunit II [Pseudomonadota bacterium]